MRVLVARPRDQAARTARKLLNLGLTPVLAPVLEIAPTGASLPEGRFDLLLATSARAFDGLALSPTLRGLPLACVGEKTAEAAAAAGFAVCEVAPDASALVDALLRNAGAKSALYLAGRDRKDHLEAALRAAGWRVETVETYAARPVQNWPDEVVASLASGEIDAILHFSPRSAEIALALAGPAAARLRHFCLAPQIADVCRAHAPAENILVASHPDENSLMTLLSRAH